MRAEIFLGAAEGRRTDICGVRVPLARYYGGYVRSEIRTHDLSRRDSAIRLLA
jgi:hypothetical protein